VFTQLFPMGEKRVGGTSPGNYTYTFDHLGSLRELVDSTGTVRARYDYDPWGRRTKLTGDLDSERAYTGHFQEEVTGLLLAPFRAYDVETGRWLSRDPLGEMADGPNLYAYVGGNPVNFVDPDGRDAVPVGGGAYNFQVNPSHYGADRLSDVFDLMNDRYVNHPNEGYSGQCATGAQAMTGAPGPDGLWRDSAPGSLSNWFQGPSVADGGIAPGTMIAAGWPNGRYGGANGHTGIYAGKDKNGNHTMFAQNAPPGSPFSMQFIDPSDYFEVRSLFPYDEGASQCYTP
jgi:RHS repeat-associated protein